MLFLLLTGEPCYSTLLFVNIHGIIIFSLRVSSPFDAAMLPNARANSNSLIGWVSNAEERST
jgi:hypothetical protein